MVFTAVTAVSLRHTAHAAKNHFVEFADLYEEDKEAMIEDYLKEE